MAPKQYDRREPVFTAEQNEDDATRGVVAISGDVVEVPPGSWLVQNELTGERRLLTAAEFDVQFDVDSGRAVEDQPDDVETPAPAPAKKTAKRASRSRSAGSGRFVDKANAKANPGTTVNETT